LAAIVLLARAQETSGGAERVARKDAP
jgi:hypothetical protein